MIIGNLLSSANDRPDDMTKAKVTGNIKFSKSYLFRLFRIKNVNVFHTKMFNKSKLNKISQICLWHSTIFSVNHYICFSNRNNKLRIRRNIIK